MAISGGGQAAIGEAALRRKALAGKSGWVSALALIVLSREVRTEKDCHCHCTLGWAYTQPSCVCYHHLRFSWWTVSLVLPSVVRKRRLSLVHYFSLYGELFPKCLSGCF